MYVDYDWEEETGTGKPRMAPDGSPEERPENVPPPCFKCPKQSPDKEHLYVLSDKNWRTYELYQLGKATCGACYTPQMLRDGILRQNLSVIERIVKAHEQHKLAETILSVPRL